jgi:hypothetical protein
MDVSGRILRTWMPAIHAGMTKVCTFISAGDRKIVNTKINATAPDSLHGSIDSQK